MEDPVVTDYMSVLLPEDIEPDERFYRYSVMLDAELRLVGVGSTEGGGTMLSAERADGGRDVLFVILDVDAASVDGAREVLQRNLPELGCPAGTLIQYGDQEDRFDGFHWHLGETRSIEEY